MESTRVKTGQLLSKDSRRQIRGRLFQPSQEVGPGTLEATVRVLILMRGKVLERKAKEVLEEISLEASLESSTSLARQGSGISLNIRSMIALRA